MNKKQQYLEKCRKAIVDKYFAKNGELSVKTFVELENDILTQLSECWDMAGEEKQKEIKKIIGGFERTSSAKLPYYKMQRKHGVNEFRKKLLNSLTSKQEEK